MWLYPIYSYLEDINYIQVLKMGRKRKNRSCASRSGWGSEPRNFRPLHCTIVSVYVTALLFFQVIPCNWSCGFRLAKEASQVPNLPLATKCHEAIQNGYLWTTATQCFSSWCCRYIFNLLGLHMKNLLENLAMLRPCLVRTFKRLTIPPQDKNSKTTSRGSNAPCMLTCLLLKAAGWPKNQCTRIVYFDQISGACSTWKLVKILFIPIVLLKW